MLAGNIPMEYFRNVTKEHEKMVVRQFLSCHSGGGEAPGSILSCGLDFFIYVHQVLKSRLIFTNGQGRILHNHLKK
jgi:hypothetical protein